jgi:hypothetical protein
MVSKSPERNKVVPPKLPDLALWKQSARLTMAKKKSIIKSKVCNKKSCEKKCNKVEQPQEEIPVVIPPKANQFFSLIKRVFGYE